MPDPRAHLRVLPAPTAAACAAPGCHLPVIPGGGFGFCWACERVYRTALVLCERLLERDVARLEHETPGITAAARAALASSPHPLGQRPDAVRGCAHPAPAQAPWEALLPLPGDLDGLDDLLSELHAALRLLGVIT